MQEFTFENTGSDFSSLYQAEDYLKERGYSVGSMQGTAPIGLMKGEYLISKWRNMGDAEKQTLDGQIIPDPDFRNGRTKVQFNEMDDILNFDRDLGEKIAQSGNRDDWGPFWESINKLDTTFEKVETDEEPITHVERSPGSDWGGKEVDDGILYKATGKVLKRGSVKMPFVSSSEDTQEAIEGELLKGWEEWGSEIFPDIEQSAAEEIGEGSKITGINFEVLDNMITDYDNRIYDIEIEISFEAEAFQSKGAFQSEWRDRWL